MKLQIQIENVVAAKEKNYFIAVQLEYDDKVTPSQKFRTQVATASNRPKYNRNLFTFQSVIELQKLKFGLMLCENGAEASITTAKMIGTASLSLSRDRLKTLPTEGNRQILHFFNKEKDVGQFECIIRYRESSKEQEENPKSNKEPAKAEFNPLISRILFSEEGARDAIKTESSLSELQRQMNLLYRSYSTLKQQEEHLENIYATLCKDSQELKNDIETYEKINEKVAVKINQKEHLQSLKLEIDMLKGTEEGKRLLLERLEYFDERILLEGDQYRKLTEQYERVKGEIERRIKNAEDYANRLRGKEEQEFQLQRCEDMLRNYEEVEYEFKCNQQIINSLAQKTKKSDLTAEQAGLLLSQVNFHIQLEEVSLGKSEDEGLLKMIEGEAAFMGKYEQQHISEEQRIVLQIKLSALQEQVSNIRNKIKRALPKNKAIYQSHVIPM